MYKPFGEDQMLTGVEEVSAMQKAPVGTPEGGNLLVVIIHKGEDLEGKHHTHPSVCVLFHGEEKRTKESLGYVQNCHWRKRFEGNTFDGSIPRSFSNLNLLQELCGHCKKVAPEYEKLGASFKKSKYVLIGKMDCDAYKGVCSKLGVSGYPTIQWFPKRSLEPKK
ncbi:unnamed protein product [Lactuca saligna]|uniref:Thioredoxin domain-containing protein n=1 Tax=Lactuca saligna TaxID=75948 RepID=A0AA35UUG8_LACSI|nr:unnamed protein product [Lactuca saligna]